MGPAPGLDIRSVVRLAVRTPTPVHHQVVSDLGSTGPAPEIQLAQTQHALRLSMQVRALHGALASARHQAAVQQRLFASDWLWTCRRHLAKLSDIPVPIRTSDVRGQRSPAGSATVSPFAQRDANV